MSTIRAIIWDGDALLMLDQRRLPVEETWLRLTGVEQVRDAIADLVVRGAPAIGVSAAFGLALAARADATEAGLRRAGDVLRKARPTAVNLAWAVDRVLTATLRSPQSERIQVAEDEARSILEEDRAACRAMAGFGADLFESDAEVSVMTHCNAGALATAGIGTAVGVVRELHARGRLRRLWSCETRPVLQGARLTAWEALRDGLPVTLICDTAAGTVFSQENLAAVIVGADRIAADGGTANKIGTYNLAVLASRHEVPFYVAAPTSTVDLEIAEGHSIPIERRDGLEITEIFGQRIAPEGIDVFNPAFDVSPPELITAIITDRGVAYPPFTESLAELCGGR
jgi:methylthioribose-1-phosphate isomerase